MVKRLATLVGCNYAHTAERLYGCINDVKAMQTLLIERFGFRLEDIEILTDDGAPDSPTRPTGVNIKKVLGHMIDLAAPGDILFFHYSGHGTLIPVPGKINPGNVDFRILINRLPEGVSFTMLSDSCHSGGLIDKEKEQIGPHVSDRGTHPSLRPHERPRFISFASILSYLSSISVSGHISVEAPSMHLAATFGDEVSAKYQQKNFKSHSFQPVGLDNGILLSGCQENERSADMNPNGDGSEAYGAFSNAVQKVLRAHQGVISNRMLVTLVRVILQSEGFEQHPCLYCSDKNADAPFLSAVACSSVEKVEKVASSVEQVVCTCVSVVWNKQ